VAVAADTDMVRPATVGIYGLADGSGFVRLLDTSRVQSVLRDLPSL